MFKIIHTGFNLFPRGVITNSVKRFFLSKAYRCDEAWENRLKNSAFKNVDFSTLYFELDINLKKNNSINILDIDLLFNSIKDVSFKNELDDVLLQLRLCPECSILPERAMHSVIRWYIDNVSSTELFNNMNDRLNYGLFPDYYLTNLMMDKYLKANDPKCAVKAAVLQMFQEDLNNPIMQALALHSCYSYLESPDIWESFKEPEPDPDEEVVKVRVKFCRNPYFDDHFDITDTNHLVGKTLWMFGLTVDGAIGISSQLVGLVLYEKYEKCAEFLEEVIQKGMKLHAEAVAKAQEYSIKKPKQTEDGNKEEKKAEGGSETKADEKSKVETNVDVWKNRVLELLGKINKENLVKNSLLTDSAEFVREMVKQHESDEIKNQCKIYEQWEKEREEHINREIKKAKTLQVKSEIERINTELKNEEEKLFFFDREHEIQMIIEKKEKEMKKVFFYQEKKKKNAEPDNYVPPNVHTKKF